MGSDRAQGAPTVRSAASLAPLLAALLLAPTFTPRLAALECGGSRLYYTQTGNGADLPAEQKCSDWGFCEEPVLVGPTYTMNAPNCSAFFGSCGMEAELQVTFPGNHQNSPSDIGFGYSYGALELYGSGGGLVGACGVPGQAITQDFGTARVTGSADCLNPLGGLYTLYATMCKSAYPSRCIHTVMAPIDFGTAAGCIVPPTERCGTGDASCRNCLGGGVGAGGSPPGFGGPASPATGPGARLRYTAQGVGHPGLPGSTSWNVTLGRYWSHDYAQRIVASTDEKVVYLLSEYGTFRRWESPDGSGVYQDVIPSNEYRTLRQTGGVAGTGWTLEELDGTAHVFDAGGFWQSTTDRNGNATTATYADGALAQVDFPDGRREDFTYYPSGDPAEGKLQSITEVGVDGSTSRVWGYEWTGEDLTRIDRPDGTALVFVYGDPSFPGYLTRVELEGDDGTSTRVVRAWEVDAEGNAVATWTGDTSKAGPDAVDLWELSFDDPAAPAVTTVTDPLGQEIVYEIGRDTVSDNVRVTSISGDCPVCGLGPNVTLAYDHPDHPLLPTSTTDGRGITTAMSYDANGRLTSRTEAMGEPEERTTTWTYDTTYPGLVISMEVPSVADGGTFRTTEWDRDASGNATIRRITGTEAGSAFSYDTVSTFNAAGQPLTTDPPGHGTGDVTSWSYDSTRGDLVADSRTDPLLGQTGATDFGYDPFNRRTSVTDPNGVETTTSYDPLDRVTEIRQVGASPPTDDLVTSHEYTTFGDLLRTTLPEGNVIEYGYDAAGRLTSIERKSDASSPPSRGGERTLYTLDAAGNRTRETLQRWDTATATWVTTSETESQYSSRCQVDRIIQAPGTAEEARVDYSYDCNGNLSEQWDANHDAEADPPTTSYTYDALDRLTAVTQTWGGAGGGNAVTQYQYDVQDHLIQVTDAEGNVTSYTYSDRDLLTHELSEAFVDPPATCNPAPACDPGCGCTAYSYDEHGELVESTDARGITTTRTVDALNRVTFIDYPDDTLDTTYTYDTQPAACGGTSFPVGRLSSIERDGQTVDSCYDRFGRVVRDGELTYGHDANGNRTAIGYPGGVNASYGFDFADRQTSLSVTSPGGTEPVVSAAGYLPSGPLSSLILGSSVTETRSFDGRYAPTGISLSAPVEKTFTYTTDPVGNVLEIVEQPLCTAGPLLLENQIVTTEETYVSCGDIQSGNAFAIESPGDVTFLADGTITLTSGFSVGTGARFEAGSGALPELSRRSFGYQDVQYFLTSASGPWPEALAWTYDRIGNRLTETRDAGTPETDTYTYRTNSTSGNTPILDQITLGIGGTRDYTWGDAGHLEQVAAGANVIDFAADAEGRMSSAARTAAGETAGFTYDGRSFLAGARQTAGGTASVEPVYDSAGMVHALRRMASSGADEELALFLYLAGRPVAQLEIDGTGTETWTYLTTDHLGAPLVATDDTGAVTWEGGFQPFGGDWQEGTSDGAFNAGIYLRLPGQWDETTWQGATSGAGVYYNVHRWYQPGTGRYTRPDLIPLAAAQEPYLFSRQRPTAFVDRLGLQATRPHPTGSPFNDACCGQAHRRNLFAATAGGDTGGIVVCCNGTKVPCVLAHEASQLPPAARMAYRFSLDCLIEHEERHIPDLPDCPPCDQGPMPVELSTFPTPAKRRASECPAAEVELDCLERSKSRCAGDPRCIDWLNRFKAGPRGLQRDSGCPTP